MRRIISIFILFVVFIAKVCGQTTVVNTIDINLLDGSIISYPLINIESVKHDANGSVSFNTHNAQFSYDIDNISSIKFSHQDYHSYFYLTEEDLDEWDEGICDSNGCFLAYRQEADGGFMAIIGDGEHLESTITLKFDSEFNIESIFSNQGYLTVYSDDEANRKYYVILTNGEITVTEIANNNSTTNIKGVSSRNAANALNTIFGWANNALTIQDFGKLLSNGFDDLPGFLGGEFLSLPIWGYGNLGSLALSLFLHWAEDQYENDYYRLLRDYMGSGNIYISDIDEKNMPKYNIEATIYDGLDTMGTPLTCSIHSGIAVKLNDSHVFYEDCDMILNDHEVKSDCAYTATLEATRGITYYLRPYLIVMIDRPIEPTPLTRPAYLWGGKPQPLVIYGDVRNICFNPNITVTTGDCSNITETSAIVECSFGKLPKGAICGVKYSSDGENFSFQSCTNEEGVQTITLSGLEPMTSYTYFAYVEYEGEAYYGDTKSFTTNPPDISGTWNVVETYSTRPFPGGEWETKTKEYTLHLNTDGSVNVEGLGYDYIGGGWSYGNGRFGATCHVIATQTQNSWDRYEGVADDIKNPQKITGTRYVGNMNQVTNVENAAGSIVMTR